MVLASVKRGPLAPMLFLVAALSVATAGAAATIVSSPQEAFYSVSVVEITNAPSDLVIPWLLKPAEPFLPGIAVADGLLVKEMERSGSALRVLGEYVESDNLYLVQTSPFVSDETLSMTGRVLWSSGGTHLVSVSGDIRQRAALPNLRCTLLTPVEEARASGAARSREGRDSSFQSLPLQDSPSTTEKQWIDLLVGIVSQAEIEKTLAALTGASPVTLPSGVDSILTRFSYLPGPPKAAEYLYSRFDSMAIDVEYDSFFGVPLKAVAFVGPAGFAAGGDGIVYRTKDGGDTWERQDAHNGDNLWKVSMTAADTCWIAGGFGVLLRTTDGGVSWQKLPTGTLDFLYGVKFVNSQVGWLCGDAGLVRKSVDGGETWRTQNTNTTQRLYDIEFTDSLRGWAVGGSGAILRTSDGGENWEVRTDVTVSRLYDVCFVDSLHGWAVGAGGTVVCTSDGGESWTSQPSGLSSSLMGVSFVDDLRGWAVGSAGFVIYTSDGGAHWTRQPSGTYFILYGVYCTDSSHGCAVGNGAAVRTETGSSWPSIGDRMPDQWLNVVATINGTTTPSRHYVVGAHYDDYSQNPTVLAPGADDNATGVSVVVEVARILKNCPLRSSVKCILFEGEEQGLAGSNHYAANARGAGEDIGGMLNFDMVGYGTPDISLYCNAASEWLVARCFAARDAFVPWLELTKSVDPTFRYSDHSMFWDRSYSALCAIEADYSSNPYYHSTGDVLDHLTTSITTDAARLAVAVLASLAGPDTLRLRRSVAEVPSTGQGPVLGLNYPNPFNPFTSVPFSLPSTVAPTNYVLAILDPAGRIVRILETGLTGSAPLTKTATWDGTDENGRQVASGVYVTFLRCGDETSARKIVLAR